MFFFTDSPLLLMSLSPGWSGFLGLGTSLYPPYDFTVHIASTWSLWLRYSKLLDQAMSEQRNTTGKPKAKAALSSGLSWGLKATLSWGSFLQTSPSWGLVPARVTLSCRVCSLPALEASGYWPHIQTRQLRPLDLGWTIPVQSPSTATLLPFSARVLRFPP